jgi:polar amino acid transport system substrate-binding protein
MKKVKIFALLLAVMMLVPLMLASCNDKAETSSAASSSQAAAEKSEATSSAAQLAESSQASLAVPEKIKTAGKLVMATSADFPPYEFKDDNGNYVGIDVEIMQAIADLWNVKLEVSDMKFDSVIAAVATGKADVGAAGLTITEERLESVNFTDTYTQATQVIIVKNDSEIKAVADLAGKKVGVQLGTTGDTYASDDDAIKDGVQRYNTGIDAVLALTQGKIDAVLIDNEPAKVFVKQNEGLKIIDEKYTDENYAFATAKDNKELVNALNEALAVLDSNGKLDEIVNKYIKAE